MICDDEDVFVMPHAICHIHRSGVQSTAQQFGEDWDGPVYACVFPKAMQPKAYARNEMPPRRRAWRRPMWRAWYGPVLGVLVGLLMGLCLLTGGKGTKRTFSIPNVGVFQRIAADDSPEATVLLYAFKPSAKLPPHMRLRAAMIRVIGERFAAIFTEEFTKEILRKAASFS
jgi:hypothetical protein